MSARRWGWACVRACILDGLLSAGQTSGALQQYPRASSSMSPNTMSSSPEARVTTEEVSRALAGSRGRGRGHPQPQWPRPGSWVRTEGSGVTQGGSCPCVASLTLGQRGLRPRRGSWACRGSSLLGCLCWLPGNFCCFHDLPSPCPLVQMENTCLLAPRPLPPCWFSSSGKHPLWCGLLWSSFHLSSRPCT